jgi:hypothetical protein
MKISETLLRKIIKEEVAKALQEEDLQEIFGLGKRKELDPEVADLVGKIKAERTRFVHPDFIPNLSAYRKWQRELKNTEKLLKKGKVSPEEIKQKYGID